MSAAKETGKKSASGFFEKVKQAGLPDSNFKYQDSATSPGTTPGLKELQAKWQDQASLGTREGDLAAKELLKQIQKLRSAY